MKSTELWTAVDQINCDESHGPMPQGLFDSIKNAIQWLPKDKWAILGVKITQYKDEWEAWHDLVETNQVPFCDDKQWKGQGSMSYVSLIQTALELCKALEDLKDWFENLVRTQSRRTMLGEEQVKLVLTIVCRLQECFRFTEFVQKGQTMTDAGVEELNIRIENKIVEELKDLYDKTFENKLVLQDPQTWKTLRPQPIGQAVKAAAKDKAAPRYNPGSQPQPNAEGSQGTTTGTGGNNRGPLPGSNSETMGGQAA
ncbi:hypothetical protein B0T20DRAFT_63047 [Sordaria brevicollis]|uniref:Uncharacterized protein n=1 Tax=Sordaria brevicollis TaxID=83679 RepID=A0AAE0U5F2_SORBR|nr:hypothetical protein B0T20DRAFT_63047 [Sordaria brevicollis]